MNATDPLTVRPVATPGEGTIAKRVAAGLGLRPSPLNDWHFSRLAIVFIRQSDPQQVLNHIESRERQYALVDLAAALGWPRDRILVIDEDQGKSGKTADGEAVALLANDSYQCMHRVPGAAAGRLIGSYRAA